jgi:hypothetical protein
MKKTEKNEHKTYISIDFLRKLDKVDPYIKDLFISLADEIQRIANAKRSGTNIAGKPTEARKKKVRKDRHNEKNIES